MKPEVMLEVDKVAADIFILSKKIFLNKFSCLFCYKENLKGPVQFEYTENS
jgi:hypothetical protein